MGVGDHCRQVSALLEDGEAYTTGDHDTRDNGREEADYLMVLDTYGNEIERFPEAVVWGMKVE